MIHRLGFFLLVTTESESFLYFASILEPPKPFNVTLYTLKANRRVPNVLWYTFGHPDFFTLIVCKIEKMCYKQMVHQETRNYSKINQWTKQMDMNLETGKHRLYIESHSCNMSVTSTEEFIIGKNSNFFQHKSGK